VVAVALDEPPLPRGLIYLLMTIEDAIKEAKKGGWEPKKGWHFEDQTIYEPGLDIPNIVWDLEHCFLDPSFWQSLGKELNWNGGEYFSNKWRIELHRFIDYIADGKSPHQFFGDLN
jgi:hypothetical protein